MIRVLPGWFSTSASACGRSQCNMYCICDWVSISGKSRHVTRSAPITN